MDEIGKLNADARPEIVPELAWRSRFEELEARLRKLEDDTVRAEERYAILEKAIGTLRSDFDRNAKRNEQGHRFFLSEIDGDRRVDSRSVVAICKDVVRELKLRHDGVMTFAEVRRRHGLGHTQMTRVRKTITIYHPDVEIRYSPGSRREKELVLSPGSRVGGNKTRL
jgi:hypothetical protein